jgi:hypothetical protein
MALKKTKRTTVVMNRLVRNAKEGFPKTLYARLMVLHILEIVIVLNNSLAGFVV